MLKGIGSWLGSNSGLVGGLGSLAGSLFGSSSRASSIRSSNEANMELNEANLDWAKEQYYDSKNWQNKASARDFKRMMRMQKRARLHDHTMFARSKKAESQIADREWQRAKRASRNFAGNQMQDLIDTAGENGIHALAALGGGSPGYTPVQGQPVGSGAGGGAVSTMPGGPIGSDPGTIPMEAESDAMLGDAIGDAIRMGMAINHQSHEQKMSEADLENRKAQTALMAAQSRSIIAETRRNMQDMDTYDQESAGKDDVPELLQEATIGGKKVVQLVGDQMGVEEMIGIALTTGAVKLKDLYDALKDGKEKHFDAAIRRAIENYKKESPPINYKRPKLGGWTQD